MKKKLDHSIILRNKIRIARIVPPEKISNMIFKLKVKKGATQGIKDAHQRYFNEQNLEREVERIIKDIFLDSVEVNKIIIPMSKKDKNTPLNYARVFLHISNLKEATRTAKAQKDPN